MTDTESASEELLDIDQTLNRLELERKQADERTAIVTAQLAILREELSRLQEKSYSVKKALGHARIKRESAVRKVELERQAAELTEKIEAKKAEARELIKDAPWINDAFDWQIEGAIRLPERALLGDKRGLGKTLSSIIWRRVNKCKKTLVCLRKEVASDFIKELSIREPGLFVYPMIGATPQERQIAAMLLAKFDEFVVVTNIESWRRDAETTVNDIMRIPYDSVILDEAHHIKNSGTGTAQGFFKLAARVPKILELTGTPIKNRPQEMYSLLHALYPDLFPNEKFYLRDFCVPVGQNKYKFSEHGLVQLVKKISAFYLARTPEDIGRNVPPPRMIEYKLDMNAHLMQKQAYKVIAERSMAVLNSGDVIPIVSQLAIMTRLAQVVSWPAGIRFEIKDPDTQEVIDVVKFDVHESAKMDWAEDLLQELVSEGERVILFSRFKPAIYELERRLVDAGLSVAVITGDRKSDVKEIFDDFDLKTAPEKPKYDVLLATYQTVGESANLNAARHMILYDRYWNPGNDDQAIGRIDRINSVDQATVHLPEVESTIDEYMSGLINEKRSLVDDFKSAADQQYKLAKHLENSI